jgi:predicted outer membrane repeat protein
MTRLLAWLLMLTVLSTAGAKADSVVTLCQSDRQAGTGVNLANAVAATGNITFNCPAGSVIKITATMTVPGMTSISGNGITLDASSFNQPIFHTPDQPIFSLSGLTVKGPGAGSGGMALVQGNGAVTLSDLSLQNLPAAVLLASAGNLQLDGITFDHSRLGRVADYSAVTLNGLSGGDPDKTAPFMDLNAGTIAISGSSISNSLHSILTFGKLTISKSSFSGNASSSPKMTDNPPYATGGALFLSCLTGVASCAAAIGNSTFTGNIAPSAGALFMGAGSLVIAGNDFNGNGSSAGPGGAVYTDGTMLQLLHSTFENNSSAAEGGAMLLADTGNHGATFRGAGAMFSGNTAKGAGGGISAHIGVTLNQALFLRNTATGAGGALWVSASAQSRLSNALVLRNSAAASGGAILGGDLALINSTLAGNTGGVAAAAGGLTIANTILSQNGGANCTGSITNVSGNLQYGDTSCGAAVAVGDPELDTYAAPAPGSAAATGGNVSICRLPPVDGLDFYGNTRAASACAIGAVEKLTDQQIADHDQRYSGLLLPEAIAVAGIVYFTFGVICGLVCLLRRRNSVACATAKCAFIFSVVCALLLLLTLLVWAKDVASRPVLDQLLWIWIVLVALGIWRLLRRIKSRG